MLQSINQLPETYQTGCPSGQFFQLWGKLSSELDYAVDLVSLDLQQDFGHFLEEEQELMKIV